MGRRLLGRALYSPEPTQDIHSENSNARSRGNARECLFCTRFAVCEAVASDHDCNQTCNLRDRASEKGLYGVKAGVERRTLRQHGHRHEKKQGKNNGGWTDAFRPKKTLGSADEMNLGPTSHMHLQKQL